MASAVQEGANSLFAMGKQMWDSFSQMAQSAASQQPSAAWSQPFEMFSKMAGGSEEFSHTAERVTQHGRQFIEFMQSLASRAAGGEQIAVHDIGSLWRRALGGGNPLLDALRTASGEGARGFEKLAEDATAMFAQLRGQLMPGWDTPAFGYTREMQERWQALFKAKAEYLEKTAAYNALLLKASQRGMEYFESKLAERSEPGRQIESARSLYDLWVDAAEEAYSEIALSPEFRVVYGEMVNALMRLRQAIQIEVEEQTKALGMPTRTEVDGSHRKVHELQREVRELKRQINALTSAWAAVAGEPEAEDAAPAVKAKAATAATAKKPVSKKRKQEA